MHRLAGFALVALSACCFGIMPILARIAYSSGAGTTTLLFLRFAVGGLFMAFYLVAKKLRLPDMKTLLGYVAMGAIGYAGQSYCYFTALKYASASLVALLLYIYPALVTLLSALFLHERIGTTKALALALASAGSALVIGFGGSGDARGIALALGAAAIYSVYIVCGSRIVGRGMAIQSSTVIMLSASIVFGLSLLKEGFRPPGDIGGLAATVAIALVSTVAAIWSFFAGLERIGPTKASLVSTLEPAATVACAALLLGERLSATNAVGGVLVLLASLVIAFPEVKAGRD